MTKCKYAAHQPCYSMSLLSTMFCQIVQIVCGVYPRRAFYPAWFLVPALDSLLLSHFGLPPGSCPELFVLSAVSVLPVDNYTSTCTDFCLLRIAAGLINCLLALKSSVVLL